MRCTVSNLRSRTHRKNKILFFSKDDIDLIDLNSVFDKVLSKHKERLQEKEINVDVDECDYEVSCGTSLEELFYNLIENPIERSDRDEIKIPS